MYGNPRPEARPAAAIEAHKILERLVRRVAAAGRLRVGVGRATRPIHAAGVGVVLTLSAVESIMTMSEQSKQEERAEHGLDPD